METGGADQFLVQRVREGDQSAWRQLIDRYSGRLLAYARSRLASMADAEDLVQETLVGLLQSLAHYDPNRDLETYLFTILRYKLCDQFRQRKVAVINAPSDNEDWWDQALPGDPETPSNAAARLEAQKKNEVLLTDLLRRLIAELRDRNAFTDLQVIELIFYAGKRNLDVADLLAIDQKAVAGVKFRAIQKLQSYLDEGQAPLIESWDEQGAETTVSRVWRAGRLTCLKRGTLGSYLLGVLDEPWRGYTQFHLDVVGCPLCIANLADLQEEESQDAARSRRRESIFASSVGFLSAPGSGR